jgi:hypothetical protein
MNIDRDIHFDAEVSSHGRNALSARNCIDFCIFQSGEVRRIQIYGEDFFKKKGSELIPRALSMIYFLILNTLYE